jgi:hypothetical protein
MMTAANSAALAAVASAQSSSAAQPGTRESHTAAVAKWANAGPGVSISEAAADYYMGEEVEKAIDASLVNEMISIAQATFANLAKLKGMRAVAAAVMQAAQSDSSGDADQAARIRALAAVGPALGAMIASANTINSRVNAMVMSGLVRAVGRTGKGPEEKDALQREKVAATPELAAAKPAKEPKPDSGVKTEAADGDEAGALRVWLGEGYLSPAEKKMGEDIIREKDREEVERAAAKKKKK